VIGHACASRPHELPELVVALFTHSDAVCQPCLTYREGRKEINGEHWSPEVDEDHVPTTGRTPDRRGR